METNLRLFNNGCYRVADCLTQVTFTSGSNKISLIFDRQWTSQVKDNLGPTILSFGEVVLFSEGPLSELEITAGHWQFSEQDEQNARPLWPIKLQDYNMV